MQITEPVTSLFEFDRATKKKKNDQLILSMCQTISLFFLLTHIIEK